MREIRRWSVHGITLQVADPTNMWISGCNGVRTNSLTRGTLRVRCEGSVRTQSAVALFRAIMRVAVPNVVSSCSNPFRLPGRPNDENQLKSHSGTLP
jgi:hypothetical protein